jgi:hypothetical protein
MYREHLQCWWKPILALYLISFLLPVFNSMRSLGIFAFFLSLLGSSYSFGLFLYWVANPLLWYGVSSLRSGRWGHAAVFGGAACAFASLPSIPIQEGETFRNTAGSLMVGYWVWLASTVLLAAVGLAGWLESKVRPRPQVRLSTMTIVVAIVAAMIASWPMLLRVLRWVLTHPGGGFYVG